jgi:4-amino-4-deoxy-L-arabinose transferase-like glycosyltransferase
VANFDKLDRIKESFLLFLILLAAFLFRYFHIVTTGWIDGINTHHLGMVQAGGSIFHFSDSDQYIRLARDYIGGKGLNIPFTPPMTAWFLIAIFTIFGDSILAAKFVYSFIGTLSLLFVYLTATGLFGRAVGFITVTLCASSFALIFITGGLNTENVYLFTSSLAIYLFSVLYLGDRFSGKHPYMTSALFGAASSAAILTRTEFLLVLAILFFYGLFREGWDNGKKVKITASVLGGLLLLIGPWTVRNYAYMKNFNAVYTEANLPTFVPTALNGPYNFLEGHNPNASGTYSPAVSIGADIRLEGDGGYFLRLDPGNSGHLTMVRDGYRLGLEHIAEHPLDEIGLLGVKMEVFTKGFSNGFFLNNFPAGLTGSVASRADSFVPIRVWWLWLSLILFFAGCAVLVKRAPIRVGGNSIFRGRVRYLPLLPVIACLTTSLMFYSLTRMAFPALPWFFMVVSVGIYYLAGLIGNRIPVAISSRRWEASFTIVLFLICIAIWQSEWRLTMVKGDSLPLGGYNLSPQKGLN